MKVIAILFLVLLLDGCAQQIRPYYLFTYSQPLVQVEKDPEVNFGKFRRFSTLPTAESDKDSMMTPIAEKQVLFIVRNNLEALGYEYVNNVEEADFYMCVYYSNEYKSTYVPPSSVTIPWYVPGQTQTTYTNLYGSSGWSAWGTATTTSSGYYVPMTYTTSGHNIGAYYPGISISAFDKGSKKVLWSGRGTVSTRESDIRLSSQWLLSHIIIGGENYNFPSCSNLSERDDSKNGIFGFDARVFTLDGNNFFPIVYSVVCDSPADKQGLRIDDIINHMNGKSAINLSTSEFKEQLNKDKGEKLVLNVKRGDKLIELSLVAKDETIAMEKWRRFKYLNGKGNIVTMKFPTKP